jgi:hypothetical protein
MRLNAVTCEMCAILLCARAAGSLGTGALAWLCGSAREARVDVCGSKGYYRIIQTSGIDARGKRLPRRRGANRKYYY